MANMCCGSLRVGLEDDWFGSLYVLIALKERSNSFSFVLIEMFTSLSLGRVAEV